MDLMGSLVRLTINYMLHKKQKQFLLRLARQTLKASFIHPITSEDYNQIKEEINDPVFEKKRAVFVSLTNPDHSLRGCIGHLEAHQALWKEVIENALAAAFTDPRFFPLQKEELDKIKIEISILSPLKKINYKNFQDLLNKLHPGVDGVLIKKGAHRSTFLPQVWEKIQTKEEFLSLLCQKAGLSPDEWKKNRLEVFVYRVEKFAEKV